MDAIHGPARARPQLSIDPGVCICCAACEPVCPVQAIFDEDDLPAAWRHYAAINAEYFDREPAASSTAHARVTSNPW